MWTAEDLEAVEEATSKYASCSYCGAGAVCMLSGSTAAEVKHSEDGLRGAERSEVR